jgi:hypothetical protein
LAMHWKESNKKLKVITKLLIYWSRARVCGCICINVYSHIYCVWIHTY